jgi:diacylglycerol kinase (ATP)
MSAGTVFIVNPRSAGGETGRAWDTVLWPRIVSAIPGARSVVTGAPGHAASLADEAARNGASLVVAVGGDGTVNEVVNGLMGQRLDPDGTVPDRAFCDTFRPDPTLGIIPRGTGCDFVKTLGVPRHLDGALDVLRRAATVDADVCEMRFTAKDGRETVRYSMNMCGCGASGEVARRVNRTNGPQHGFLAFLRASLGAALTYRPPEVEIAVDRDQPRGTRLKALFVCNGQFCGGGMRVGRGAALDDGRLRVVEVGKVNAARSLFHAYRLYTGLRRACRPRHRPRRPARRLRRRAAGNGAGDLHRAPARPAGRRRTRTSPGVSDEPGNRAGLEPALMPESPGRAVGRQRRPARRSAAGSCPEPGASIPIWTSSAWSCSPPS